MSIRRFYDRWPQYNRRLTDVVASLTDEQLALRPSPEHWPVWAVIGHIAGTRVYWLCSVLGESGAETTPWPDSNGEGWEDDLDHTRSGAELVAALGSTFDIIDRILDEWTPEDLGSEVERFYRTERQLHSRASILQRLMTHEAYHGGEVSLTLGVNGLDPVYIWRPYE